MIFDMTLPARYKYLRNHDTIRKYVFSHYAYYEHGILHLTDRGKEILEEVGIELEVKKDENRTENNTG